MCAYSRRVLQQRHCVIVVMVVIALVLEQTQQQATAQPQYMDQRYPPNVPYQKYPSDYNPQAPPIRGGAGSGVAEGVGVGAGVGGRRQRLHGNNRPMAANVNYQQFNQQAATGSATAELNQQAQSNERVRAGPMRPNSSGAMASHHHKCRIWVPFETIDKYPHANRIQVDQSNQLQLIEVCCPGYGPIRWRASTICKPVCENCRNGICTAPGECQCFEEFVANDNGDCVFTCPLGCLNGRCYLDGTCQCDPGYKLDESRKFCRPICSAGCGTNPRHNCTEPEVCGCAKGYLLTDEGCQPTCQPPCGAGGYCREYNVCECEPGYNFKDGVCQADCYQKCDNGICYGHNRCICNPNFTYHERSTQCVPI